MVYSYKPKDDAVHIAAVTKADKRRNALVWAARLGLTSETLRTTMAITTGMVCVDHNGESYAGRGMQN